MTTPGSDSETNEHAMVADLRDLQDAPFFTRLFGGVSLPFRAAKFLLTRLELWKFVAIPALINTALFIGVLYLLLPRVGTFAEWLPTAMSLEFGTSWFGVAIRWILTVVLGVLSFIAAYVFVLLFGGIAASPFNDLLSERTESLLLGLDEPPHRDEFVVWGILRGIGTSIFMLLCYLFFMVWILLLNLIPVVGSILASIFATGLSALFLALEYCDAPIDRRGGGLRQKFEAIEAHRTLSIGFGLGAGMLLWIPFLNFLTMPIAVSGGTALGVVLSDWERQTRRRVS